MNYIYSKNGQKIGEINMYDTPPKQGKRIALVVGHDADSKGAYGNLGESEFDFNSELLVDLRAGGYLPEHHNYYLYYRSADINGYTNQMVDLHKRMDANNIDIAIEFHFNSAKDTSVHGNEALYCSSAGKIIAAKLDEAFDSLPNRDRGIKKLTMEDNGGGFCCLGNSVAIIAEPFFGAHQKDFSVNGRHRALLKECYKTFFNSI